jgi:hypothetical protein
MNELETKPYAKVMSVSEAAKAAAEAAHTRRLTSWSGDLRDELERELDIFVDGIDDRFFEKHFVWAVEAALEMLAPIMIVADPPEPEED